MSQSPPEAPEAPPAGADGPPPSKNRLIRKPSVFVPSAGLLVLFVLVTAIWPEQMGDAINKVNETVVEDLGWWYIAVTAGFVFFAIWVAVSRMGDIVLGKDDEKPEFGLGSWFAMLFAAGMGIGLVFFGVAEPLGHFASPPPGTAPETPPEFAQTAMDITFLHWGLHAWAIYVVVGLAVAYAVHRRNRPVSIRYALEPLLGKYVLGFWGDVIDVIAVLGTLFGVATSLGIGVTQVGAGLGYLDIVDDPGTWLLIGLIICITAVALVSVVTGVDKGIKYLSNLNMVMAVALLIFILIAGPTVFILGDFFTSIGSYVQNFFGMAFTSRPFQEDGASWLGGWTTFYWGWWISWAPFVGVFIARISKGRTVREFITGVLLVPTLVTFLWFSVLGGTALYREIFGEAGLIGEEGVNNDTALFQMLDGLPLPTLTSIVAMILIVVFFVTSSDSGSFVVDMLSSGGDPNPPVWSRAFWAAMEGAVAAVLLYVGLEGAEGADPLGALRTMAILLAFPFSIVMVMMCVATAKSLLKEVRETRRKEARLLAEQVADHINENDLVTAPTESPSDSAPGKPTPRKRRWTRPKE